MLNEHKLLRTGGLITTVAGVGMLIVTLVLVYRALASTREARMVQGRVIELVERSLDGDVAHVPRVQFETYEGRSVLFVSEAAEARQPAAYKLHQSVTVSYMQGDPQQSARIGPRGGPWIAAGVCGAIGLLLLAMGRTCARMVRDRGPGGS